MLTTVCARIARLALQLGVLGLVLIIACVSYQVFGRYVLNNTPTWAESLALLLVLYVTMLGCAVGVRDAGHIGMWPRSCNTMKRDREPSPRCPDRVSGR